MQTILAAFPDQTSAQRALESLVQNGFSRSAVHVQSADGTDGSTSGMSSAPSDSAAGTSHDGFLKSVEHFFSHLFSDDDDQTRSRAGSYSQAVRQGRSIVAVDAMSDGQVDEATSMLNECGAINIDEQHGGDHDANVYQAVPTGDGSGTTGLSDGASMRAGATGAGYGADGVRDRAADGTLDTEGRAVMPVVEEELQVGKRTVERGGVRVVKRMSEIPVSEIVNLREERAVVERRPVDRPATDADLSDFSEGTIEIRERGEEAVVGKSARVVEEVVVGKEVTERAETVSDTVRRTDVEVEQLDAAASGSRTTSDASGSGGFGGASDGSSRSSGAGTDATLTGSRRTGSGVR